MKKAIPFSSMLILALALSACGASAANQAGGNSGGPSSGGFSGSRGSPQFAQVSGLALAAGMIKLDGTPYAVTQQEAARLLPLWRQLAQDESTASTAQATQPTPTPGGTPGPGGFRFNPAMFQQTAAQVGLIEKAMPPDQLQAIQTMNLNRQDIATILQQANIQMGNFDSGTPGARFGDGGTFTPPNGTPRVFGTPGAFGGPDANGTPGAFGRNGGRGAFASFIPPTVVQGVIQWLQTKAGSS